MNYTCKYISLFVLISLASLFETQAQYFSPGFYPGGYYNRYGYNPSGLMNMPLVTYEKKGNLFWEKEWKVGRVVLKSDKVVEGYKLMYDLGNNQMLVMVNNDIKTLPLKQIKYFEWVHEPDKNVSFFVNGLDYTVDGVGLVGICEVLTTGKVQLFMKKDVDISRDNYLSGYYSARSVERASSRVEFYMAQGNHLFPISKKAKENTELFGEHADEVLKFAKSNKVKWKKPEDLIKVFDYYNSLLKDVE
ncbi:MAG: hypothetical protein CMO01_21000 [Thalassobius sp.]|nr:hypothetical protein [Thalassovita sp.]